MKKRMALTLCSLTLAFGTFLSACSDKPETKQAEQPKQQTGAPSGKNEITVGMTGDPKNWDPIDTFLIDWVNVATSIFEGLVERTGDMKLQAGLAESWEYKDDKTLQFKLRKGVTFHNGEPFNAEAVKFTFDRLLGEAGKKGPQYANYTSISSVEVVDDSTVTFKLKESDPVLLTKLASYGAVIIPPKYYQEKGDEFFNNNPVGTGPFKMESYEKDKKTVLVKNDKYWKQGLPKLDKVTFRIIPESATRLAELQTGAIDIMKRVEVSQAASLKGKPDISLLTVDAPTVHSIRFDVSKKPMDNPKVREAIAIGMDMDLIIETVLGGYGKRVNSFQSEMSFGYDKSLPLRKYDPEKAKQLLKEAGVKEGTELDFYIPGSNATFKEVAQAVQLQLQQIGLKIKLNPVEASTLINDLMPNAKAGHMYYQGWGGWTLDFDNSAYLMYHKGERYNPTFHDEKVEELLAAERSTNDQKKREAVFKDLNRRLYELTPDVAVYQGVNLWGANKRVQGFKPPVDDRLDLTQITVQ